MAVEKNQLKRIVEGALFASEKPLTVEQLAQLFFEDDISSTELIREVVRELQAECEDRGIELREVSSGFRYQVRSELGEWVSRLWDEKPARYSRALLETLALVAYRQPITRGEIEEIRGVSVSSHIIKTLLERDWVRVVGHRDVPGRPAMYATTRGFLDYFNLSNLNELPSLAEIRDLDKINEELELIERGGVIELLSQAGETMTVENSDTSAEEIENQEGLAIITESSLEEATEEYCPTENKQGGEENQQETGEMANGVLEKNDMQAPLLLGEGENHENSEQQKKPLDVSDKGNSLSITFRDLAAKIPAKEDSESNVDAASEEAEVFTDV